MKTLNYKQLLTALSELTPEQLELPVSILIYQGNLEGSPEYSAVNLEDTVLGGELYSIYPDMEDIFDDNTPVLVVDVS